MIMISTTMKCKQSSYIMLLHIWTDILLVEIVHNQKFHVCIAPSLFFKRSDRYLCYAYDWEFLRILFLKTRL